MLKDKIWKIIGFFSWEIQSIQPISYPFEGKEFYDAYIVETKNQKFFCKLETDFKGEWRLLNEYNTQKFLYKEGFPVPEPYFFFDGNNEIAEKMAFYSFLDAHNLEDKDLERDCVIEVIAETISKLHLLDVTNVDIFRRFWEKGIKEDFRVKFEKKKKKAMFVAGNDFNFPRDQLNDKFMNVLGSLDETVWYLLCKKDMHKWNWMKSNIDTTIYFIDNEFFEIGPAVFDLYEVMTNLFLTKEQKQKFILFYWEERFYSNFSKNLIFLASILKNISMLITYFQSSDKDPNMLIRAETILRKRIVDGPEKSYLGVL